MKFNILIIVLLFSALPAVAGSNCANLCNEEWWQKNGLASLKNEFHAASNHGLNLDSDSYSTLYLDSEGVSTLYFAAAFGSLEMFEFLLKKIPITIPPDPVTLLQAAVMFNSSIDHMKASLRYGVDINAQTVFGYTALHSAVSDKSDEIVLFLLDNGADASIKDDFGDTSFDKANTNNNLLETTVLRLFKASQD